VRIDQLENASVESARLLQELAQQVQALNLAEQEMQERMQLALIVGWIGIALGVGAGILALVKECSEPVRPVGVSTSRKDVGSRRRSRPHPGGNRVPIDECWGSVPRFIYHIYEAEVATFE
jgi:hypothetical protein